MQRNRFLSVLTLACLFVLDGGTSHASDNVEQARTTDPVPVVITSVPDSSQYPQPTCSKCKRVSVVRQTSATGETQGVLELTYFDELYRDFDGVIELTVLLVDDSEHVMTVEDVSLEQGDEAGWVIDAPIEWQWEQVDMVWLELVPAG